MSQWNRHVYELELKQTVKLNLYNLYVSVNKRYILGVKYYSVGDFADGYIIIEVIYYENILFTNENRDVKPV